MSLGVIGAGLGRTGTASLKLALEQLGFDPCYHMFEVLAHEPAIAQWSAVAAGAPDWEAIFDGHKTFKAGVDFPVAAYWKTLADVFPDAKIILTVRDPDSWFASTQETIFNPELLAAGAGTPFGEMVGAVIGGFFRCDLSDRDAMLARFEAHNTEVGAAFSPERLLVFEAKEGWGPLCRFLSVDIPDTAFPRVNSREETAAMLRAMASEGGA
ncbi:MAG: sulfotransferase family protein [Pseudomonadota bacterium]